MLQQDATQKGRGQAPPELQFQKWSEGLYRMLTWVMGRHPKFSRANIADELKRLTGIPVSEGMLYDWTSRGGQHGRFPLCLALHLCLVLGDFELFAFILGEHAEKVAQLVREGKGRAPETRKRRK